MDIMDNNLKKNYFLYIFIINIIFMFKKYKK